MNKKLYILSIILLTVILAVSTFFITSYYLDDKEQTEQFESLIEIMDKNENRSKNNKYADLYSQNNDFIGWISIDGTNINYPVMQSKDNPNFYLKHNFEKKYSDYGVPYMSESCNIGDSDNLIIYGHNMRTKKMFADLCKYKDRNFYEQHKIIIFDTLNDNSKYEIIATFKTVAYSNSGFKYYEFTNAYTENDFSAYIEKCKALSFYDTGVSAKYGDKLITLSTCEYSRTNGRMVVVAKRINSPE